MEIGGSLCYSKLRATGFHTWASLRTFVCGSRGFQTDVLHDDGVVKHEYRSVLEVKTVVVVNPCNPNWCTCTRCDREILLEELICRNRIFLSHATHRCSCSGFVGTVKALLTHKISAFITHTPKTHIPQQLIGFSDPGLCDVISWPVVSVPHSTHAHKFKCETRRPHSRVMGYESVNPNILYGLRGL